MAKVSPAPTIAYLAQGNVRVKGGNAAPRTVDSAYGESLREKQVRAQQKNSWKNAGGGSPFSGPLLWGKTAAPQDVPLAITSICAGSDAGGLVYSLESGSLCALLEAGLATAEERRVWNDNRTRIRHLSVSRPGGDMAFAVLHENGTANIGIKLKAEGGVKELTEGDSFDTAPHWVPGEGRKLVFQSAGIGRNREGHFLALGSFSIQELDLDKLDMNTLLEDARHDYLAPQLREDGSLYYIRRPYQRHEALNPLRVFKDFILFPFRLLFALFHFANFFSTMFSGKQLTSAEGKKAQQMNMRQMMVWGNLVTAQKRAHGDEEGMDLVPKSWELHRRDANGESKVLAGGVLAYDVAPDGTVVFTNGSAIFLLHPDGHKERILNEAMIEQVFFLPQAG